MPGWGSLFCGLQGGQGLSDSLSAVAHRVFLFIADVGSGAAELGKKKDRVVAKAASTRRRGGGDPAFQGIGNADLLTGLAQYRNGAYVAGRSVAPVSQFAQQACGPFGIAGWRIVRILGAIACRVDSGPAVKGIDTDPGIIGQHCGNPVLHGGRQC